MYTTGGSRSKASASWSVRREKLQSISGLELLHGNPLYHAVVQIGDRDHPIYDQLYDVVDVPCHRRNREVVNCDGKWTVIQEAQGEHLALPRARRLVHLVAPRFTSG